MSLFSVQGRTAGHDPDGEDTQPLTRGQSLHHVGPKDVSSCWAYCQCSYPLSHKDGPEILLFN